MLTFVEFLWEAGDEKERQERAFVNLISQHCNPKQPITLVTKDETVHAVIKAEKFQQRQKSGSEGYPDITLKTQTGVPKIYGVSPTKGDSAGRIVITDKVPKDATKIIVF